MNTTYEKIWLDRDRVWKYRKSSYLLKFLFPRSAMPSPFRILYYLVKRIDMLKRKRDNDIEEIRQADTNREYKQTMVKILTVKLHSDDESSTQDDFRDLRMDLLNHLTEKQKMNEKTLRREIEDLKETLVSKSEILELKEMIKMLVKQKSSTEIHHS